jgi:hypothetical protein
MLMDTIVVTAGKRGVIARSRSGTGASAAALDVTVKRVRAQEPSSAPPRSTRWAQG